MGKAFSATIIFLTVTANTLVAAVGTLLDGNSLVTGLLIPEETFFHRLVFSVSLLAAHIVAKSNILFPFRYGFSKLGSLVGSNKFLNQKGVLGIGAIGLATVFASFLPIPLTLEKFFDAFDFFVWAPFLLIVPPYSKLGVSKWLKWGLFFYYLLVAGISLSGNSRMGMVAPIAVIASAWVIALLMGQVQVDKKIISKVIFLSIGGLLLLSFFVDFSTAILASRAGREERTSSEQLALTIENFFDKEALHEYKTVNFEFIADKGGADEVWTEDYVSNPFLQRFIQIKFDDNCFYRINTFDNEERALLMQSLVDKTLAQFPTPVLEMLDIQINKNAINGYSIGDLIDNIYAGSNLGNFITGSLVAHAYGVFGWWYPLAVIILYGLIFAIFSGMISVINERGNDQRAFSTIGLLLPFSIFFTIAFEGVTATVSVLVRGVWQIFLIYWVAIWVLRLLGIVGFPKENKMSKDEMIKEALKKSKSRR
ncbi:hypothetical protein [Cytophaga aurantiaca]|uniref:hypothetical protein n=1 Tax=Cytophaga aurantiaca TaxID=29530 RepID=UPI0012F75366|nr:hypothetical protein [Cytophaga aurantiaca]